MTTIKTDENVGQQDHIAATECAEIARNLNNKYGSFAGSRYFELSFDADKEAVFVKVILRDEPGGFFYPVEGRLAYSDFDLKKRDAAMLMIDYIDMYFDEYFREEGGCYLPIDWANYEYDEVSFQLKGQVLNLQAENMADELLRDTLH